MQTVGDRIKSLREASGMTQVELAEKINSTKQTIYKYENNIVTNIPSDKLEKIAGCLGTSPEYLMGWADEFRCEIKIKDDGSYNDRLATYHYYLNNEAKEFAQFLYDNPDYKVLFDASKKVKKEDIEFVKQMLDRFKHEHEDWLA